MSKKALTVFIAAVLLLLSLGINLMYAQSEQSLEEGVMKKLEIILKNQVQIKEDLKLIKLAVARI
jgi:hypothetical protein